MAVSKKSTRAAKTKQKHSKKHKTTFPRLLLDLFLLSWPGRVIITGLAMAVMIGLDLLISGNQYDLFFILVGCELIATAFVFWLRLILKND